MPEPAANNRLVILEDGLLLSLSKQATYVTQFPFLAALAQQGVVARGGCGGCARRSTQRNAAYNSAKAALAGMDADNKRKLKQMLNAARLRVRYRDGTRQVEKTF